jgi:hypothetical protein
MANVLAPFGFRHIGFLSGGAPDFQLSTRLILSTNTTKIYHGDPVVKSAASKYIEQGANNTTALEGIFMGCMYIPSSGLAIPQWSPFWPGAAAAQATAYIINAPNALFLAQGLNTAIPETAIGQNIGFAIGTGSTLGGGLSGATLDYSTLSTTNTMPFQVVGVYGATNGNWGGVGPGSDYSSAYNWAIVTFNNQRFKQLTGVA